MRRSRLPYVRELLEHEERTAGRIMTRNYFAIEEEVTIAEAVAALQKRSEEFEMVLLCLRGRQEGSSGRSG
jgi:Mg/Co/Ni transporter MgtE